jgi:hypothetical protein
MIPYRAAVFRTGKKSETPKATSSTPVIKTMNLPLEIQGGRILWYIPGRIK